MKEKIRKKMVGVSASMIVILLIVVSLPVAGPGEQSPFVQQHWGLTNKMDMPDGENVGTAYFVSTDGDDSDGLTWETAFTSIQDAIDAAESYEGDYIYVQGTFFEDVDVDKSNLHIIGEGVFTQITGGFEITQKNIEITGFTIFPGGVGIELGYGSGNNIFIHDNVFCCLSPYPRYGIKVNSIEESMSGMKIIRNRFEYADIAIWVPEDNYLSDSQIDGNIFLNCNTGILLYGELNTGNSITNNQFMIGYPFVPPYYGIVLNSAGNLVSGNYFGGDWFNKIQPEIISVPLKDNTVEDYYIKNVNSYLDNRWARWYFSGCSYSGFGDSGILPILENLDIPSGGEVEVRMNITYLAGFAPGVDTIELFMYDGSFAELSLIAYYRYLDPIYAATYSDLIAAQISPSVKASVNGCDNEITICLRVISQGTIALNYNLEIIDA